MLVLVVVGLLGRPLMSRHYDKERTVTYPLEDIHRDDEVYTVDGTIDHNMRTRRRMDRGWAIRGHCFRVKTPARLVVVFRFAQGDA
ncbi:hypothetical protein EV363DRAFT_1307695, partial [Boletus edulis]|uniref:Uncharacterized protein n=1 Tax=Boletus edulis BED1 TaxID=1328754 RepID=A0AAD4GJ95_BOLED